MDEARWHLAMVWIFGGIVIAASALLLPSYLETLSEFLGTDPPTPTPPVFKAAFPLGCVMLSVGLALLVGSLFSATNIRQQWIKAVEAARAIEERQRAAHERAQLAEAHQKAITAHEELRDAYAAFLHDLDERIALPALSDLAVPETEAFVRALADANDLRPTAREPKDDTKVEAYAAAVSRAERAWDEARNRAAADAEDAERRRADQASVKGLRAASRRLLHWIFPSRSGSQAAETDEH